MCGLTRARMCGLTGARMCGLTGARMCVLTGARMICNSNTFPGKLVAFRKIAHLVVNIIIIIMEII